MNNDYIVIIGGGLAGCEAAYQCAKRGIKVEPESCVKIYH